MSLSEGQITSTDISPNAGILGTQIADNTIQLRNLADSTFRIVKTDTVTFSKAANSNSASLTVAHGLGYAPAILAYFTVGSFIYPFGQVGAAITGANSGKITETSGVTVDSTNIYFQVSAPDWAGNGNYTSAETYAVKYYLLQEKASIT